MKNKMILHDGMDVSDTVKLRKSLLKVKAMATEDRRYSGMTETVFVRK
jgi:hypothetical protein